MRKALAILIGYFIVAPLLTPYWALLALGAGADYYGQRRYGRLR